MEGKLKGERILILTLSFGAGHVRAAEVLAAEFARREPNAEIVVVDALNDCRFLFRVFYVWAYWALVRYAPELWGRFFASRVKRRDQHTAPVWAWRWGCPTVFAQIEAFQPGMIMCCEVGAAEIAVIAARHGSTDARIVSVITDLEAEPVWIKREIDMFAVASEAVRKQLEEWGAPAGSIVVCGIPIDRSFDEKNDIRETRQAFGLDERPIVLLMGGGMGPTHMDAVAAKLLESGQELQIVALPGRDETVRRKLARLRNNKSTSLLVVEWTDEIARLMQAADLLITKPGGLTLAEAAASGVPLVLFDSIPGPEKTNAAYFTTAGDAVMASDAARAARVSLDLLRDDHRRREMAESVSRLASPHAAENIVNFAIDRLSKRSPHEKARPVMILTISNGYGHIRLAETLAAAIRRRDRERSVLIVDVADLMSPMIRFTHVTAYLLLIKHFPRVWALVDQFQKKREQTSPEWFYRRGCRRVFELARSVWPAAFLATEVGCCEIASLVKRDLGLDVPLVAVHDELDADRAWVQPEVDLYCLADEQCADMFAANGAPRERIVTWGPALSAGFDVPNDRKTALSEIRGWLGLDMQRPLLLVSGGGAGLGAIEETTGRLLDAKKIEPQVIVLAGRNDRLKARCERLAANGCRDRLRVLGWIDPEQMPKLMRAADLMISKLGRMANEAIAAELPIVALEPPPGAERIQYNLLNEWNVGRAVRTQDELVEAVSDLLENPDKISAMREEMRRRRKPDAAFRIADWLAA